MIKILREAGATGLRGSVIFSHLDALVFIHELPVTTAPRSIHFLMCLRPQQAHRSTAKKSTTRSSKPVVGDPAEASRACVLFRRNQAKTAGRSNRLEQA
jgi:hypothetical protein